MFKNIDFGKYSGVVISVALFIILDASVLGLNFYISFSISEDAANVNLAGRQRMLSQRMVKSLYGTESPDQQVSSFGELQLTTNLFDQTLTAFDKGGTAPGANNDIVQLKAVESPKARAAIEEASALWAPYKIALTQLLAANAASDDSAMGPIRDKALAYGEEHNLKILKLMNTLTVELENEASQRATTLRVIQTIGITLAIINFFIILFHFIRQLNENDRKLESARKETTEILDTVQEGLFLVDEKLNIGNQQSKQLESILGIPEVAGKSFIDVMSDLVTPKDLITAKKFIEVLFDPKVVEKLVRSLNPLEEVQIHIPVGDGSYATRYLKFAFARVHEGAAIKHILVTVTDITREIKLQQKLDASEMEGEQQMKMLTAFLHTDPATLGQFLKSTRKSLERANEILKKPLASTDTPHLFFSNKANTLRTEIHRVKGDASALSFDGFASRAHEFESELAIIANQTKVEGNDFLPLTMRLEQLFKYADSVQQLSDRLSGFQKIDSAVTQELEHDWKHLKDLANKIADEESKPIEFLTSGLYEHKLDSKYHSVINSTCIQLIRNAIIHGIEPAEERASLLKPATARIEIKLAKLSDKRLELTIRDDGRGIDFEKIRSQTIESGLATEMEIAAWDNKKLFSMIFRPDFSTAEETNEYAGRGVGMNVVLQDLRDVQGKLKAWTRRGGYTQFSVTLPAIEDEMIDSVVAA